MARGETDADLGDGHSGADEDEGDEQRAALVGGLRRGQPLLDGMTVHGAGDERSSSGAARGHSGQLGQAVWREGHEDAEREHAGRGAAT